MRRTLPVLAVALLGTLAWLLVESPRSGARSKPNTPPSVEPVTVAIAPPAEATKTAEHERVEAPRDTDPRHPPPQLVRGDVPVRLGQLGAASGVVSGSSSPPALLPPELFAFAADGWVFLRPLDAGEAHRWASGEMNWRLREGALTHGGDYPGPEGVAFGQRAVASERLPLRWTSWIGRLLVLGRGAEAQCHARVTELGVVTRATVGSTHYGRYMALGTESLDDALTRDLWGTAPAWLAARVVAEPGQSCTEAEWARDGFLDLPVALQIEELPCEHAEVRKLWPIVAGSEVVRDWREGFGDEWSLPGPRDLAEVRRALERQRNCEEQHGPVSTCDGPLAGPTCVARRFVDSGRHMVALEVRIDLGAIDGRASFHGDTVFGGASLLLEAQPPQTIALEREWQRGRISHAIDFDGDGVAEWFGGEHMWRLGRGMEPQHLGIWFELENR